MPLEVSLGWVGAGGVGDIVGGAGTAVVGAGIPIERVTLLLCSRVAVDRDDVFCCVGADDGGGVICGMRAVIGGAGAVAGWLVCPIGIGGSSSSLLLR